MFAENSDKKPLEPIERDERFRLRSFSTIPMRYVFVGLSFIGFFLVYSFKAVLSMAIVAMVNDKDDHHSISARNLDDSKFNWNDAIKNNLLGSFFYGYVLTQIPAGIFGNKYGGKWIFSVCLLIASICSLLSPIAARQSYLFLMGLRFVQGLVEGVVFPCMNTLIAQWMPIMERTRGSTIIFSGSLIGSVFTLQTTSYFNDSQWGWPASFYLLGTIGVIWFVLFATLVYECPESHPYISLEERNYIVENGGGKRADMDVKIPYRKILTSIPVYGLLLTNFLQNWLMLTLFLYMPTYFKDILRMSHKQITWISGLPHLGCAMFGWLCSYLTDWLRSKGHFPITFIRKINAFIAYLPPALCVALIPLAGRNQPLSCLLFVLASTFGGACFSAFNSTHVDLAPDFAGILMGFSNGFGNIPGFLVPLTVSLLTKKKTLESWSSIFYIASITNLLTFLVYALMCTAELQPWGRVEREKEKKRIEKY